MSSSATLISQDVEDYNESENTDDLEQTLVLAAQDADARSNELQTDTSYREEVEEEVAQPEPQSTSSYKAKRKHEDEEPAPKHLKTNEGQAVGRTSEGYAKVVATHYNLLEEKGLDERSKSRIVYMRNFHNWIKSMLINEYLTKIKDGKKHNAPVRVLDMCCGKGGDLLKWRKGNITHLICSDIASVSLDQCRSRYNDMKERSSRERNGGNIYSIEYIAGDCSRVRLREKYTDPSMKLDLVSCQFAFHYSFESLPQAECMIRNASECLQPGGFFIGTIPDANDLIARARRADANTFGNDVYQVHFDCDVNKPPLFGAKYNFHLDGVVDCPEFLVHFPTLIKLARKYGLKFVKKEKFYDYYEQMKNEGRQLLINMKSLETYPPYDNTPLLGTDPGDYIHAEEFLKKEGKNGKIGTLSKSEWEASSLYMLFVFEKVKNTWNTDGTPVYDI
ncbi:mRNA cap guanine-N7 methyltransferase [Tribolium castaneum]|uniref:mRNA cap guanine-N(7) methyltransferase n=1 Tax=Tribolium castaneum TaxID=7070 RepID=D6WKN1_TRICA|nr:PREDICTED: mRNA cap guanine-N7 methyltransferase [Tribolium castaneum]EFA03004.2 mRNA cap guanine-N7 methyltransferase-like Protein [Tribolium castaneum]|eukprot:XP_015835402.1 PREDICTED: mRNA cap guanine-N7 methyltransferase [Tribolium castaneum]